ncbi:LolA family protein [Virgibacillus siamensis]|uniref:LolA family protein n=1 Tax=Virgibacillus siamensis TaxID=480071 RepID=UPI000985067D|nr:outer membrane lipoprotein carrier protein LolA [Virgibacillus siamensis]
MKKQIVIRMMIALGFVLLLAACGEKSQEEVLDKLESKLEEMNGYKAKAEMKMNTGQEGQTYKIDVWHKKKDFYRVALKNAKDDKGSQIILKNEEGVFVLSPALNKSFKFQKEWPENGSQPYLFQSLVNDVAKDKDATFKAGEKYYIFQTETNYQSNNNLPYQKIYFDKKTYTPVMVKVLDKDKNPLVEVAFSEFNTSPEFKKGDFEMEKNMSAGASDSAVSGDGKTDAFSVVIPFYMAGSELTKQKEIELENGKRVIMTFSGDKNFTLVEEKNDVVPTTTSPQFVNGEIVNLGHSVGALSGNAIEWTNNGVNFYLASDELTEAELIKVAKSVKRKEVK